MRLTVLQQQTKALQEERPKTGADVSKRLENVKHLLWHGNTEEALERLDQFRLHPFGHPLQISVDASYVDVSSSRQYFSQQLRGQAVRDQGCKLVFQVSQFGRRSLRQ